MPHGPIPDKPVAYVVNSFEAIGRSFEAIPGWSRAERFLDDVAEGFAFAIALMWALRWYWAVIAVGLFVVGSSQ